jgi:hypothetical protein
MPESQEIVERLRSLHSVNPELLREAATLIEQLQKRVEEPGRITSEQRGEMVAGKLTKGELADLIHAAAENEEPERAANLDSAVQKLLAAWGILNRRQGHG